MKLQWKEIQKDDIKGQWAALYVSMNPKGRIAMSRITYERLGSPKAFKVFFEPVNNIIALKPTRLEDRNAFKACKVSRHGGRAVFAYRLIQECGISLPDTVQFHDAEIDHDRMLRLDLRTARVSDRGWNRTGRRKQQQ